VKFTKKQILIELSPHLTCTFVDLPSCASMHLNLLKLNLKSYLYTISYSLLFLLLPSIFQILSFCLSVFLSICLSLKCTHTFYLSLSANIFIKLFFGFFKSSSNRCFLTDFKSSSLFSHLRYLCMLKVHSNNKLHFLAYFLPTFFPRVIW